MGQDPVYESGKFAGVPVFVSAGWSCFCNWIVIKTERLGDSHGGWGLY